MWAKKILCGLGMLVGCAIASLPVTPVEAAVRRITTPVQIVGPELASSSVLAIDLESGQELLSRDADSVRPMASITKLMTAMVVLDRGQRLDEILTVTDRQTREMKGVFSRVRQGSQQSRGELLLLALMSSENRAASTLAHYYPGGYQAFISAMNAKARSLGMTRTNFIEPTGLSERNVSTARDLMRMLRAANRYGLIRAMTTTPNRTVAFSKPGYVEGFNNTNPLVRNDNWRVIISKTGFTNEAGHCLVMAAEMAGRQVGVVLLDSAGKQSRFADAVRVRQWLETGRSAAIPQDARRYRQQRSAQNLQSSR